MAGTAVYLCSLSTILLNFNKVLGGEYCMGYFDNDGEYHQGFSCSSSCCGSGEAQYCCSRDESEVALFDLAASLTYIVIGCVVGGIILLSLSILLCCCCCAGCPGHKNRMANNGQVIRTQQSNGNTVMYQTVPSQPGQYPPGQTNIYTPPPGGAPPQGFGYPPNQGYPPSQTSPYPQGSGYPPHNGSYPPTHFGETPSSIEMDKKVEATAPPPPYDYHGV